MKLGKLVVAIAGATVLLGALVSSASARRLSLSEQRIRAVWRTMSFRGTYITVTCEITLVASFHERTVTKTVFSLVGYIVSAAVRSPCTGGEVIILRETLPWHLEYSGFEGALPNITAIRTSLVGMSIQIRESTFGASCLARTIPGAITLSFRREPGGYSTIDTIVGTEICRGGVFEQWGSINGASSFVENGSGAIIRYSLI